MWNDVLLKLHRKHLSAVYILEMHPDLSPHLHTDECNVIIKAYKQCHKEHNFGRFLGYCNELDRALNRCLDGEYEKKRLANKAHADKWRNKVHQNQKAAV